MKKIFMVFALIFVFHNTGFAITPTADFGVVLDDNLNVLAVNVNEPAYNAGIRPGDKILYIVDSVTEYDNPKTIKDIIYRDKEETLGVAYTTPNGSKYSVITKKDNENTVAKGTFLIKGKADEMFPKLVQGISFNNDVSLILPIISVDNNLKLIKTYSQVSREDYPDIATFAKGIHGNGLKMLALETNGSIAMTNNTDDTSLVRIILTFKMKSAGILFNTGFREATSYGTLERKVIESMYKPLL